MVLLAIRLATYLEKNLWIPLKMPKDEDKPKREREVTGRWWFITCNSCGDRLPPNPPEYDESVLDYYEWVKHSAKTTNMIHYHYILHWKREKTRRQVQIYMGWSYGDFSLQIDHEGAHKYLNDGHDTIEKGEPIGNPTFRKGYRTDWEDIDAMVKSGASLTEVLNKHTGKIREDKAIMRHIARQKKPFRGKRAVAILWGRAELGKSQRIISKYGADNVFVIKRDTSFPFDGYCGQENILIEDVKPFRDSLDTLKDWIDTIQPEVNIKNGSFPAAYKRVFMTANSNPTEWWPTWPDRDKLFKRIQRIVHIETEDQEDEDFPRIEREFEKVEF